MESGEPHFPVQINLYFWLNDILDLVGQAKYADAKELLELWWQNPGLLTVPRWSGGSADEWLHDPIQNSRCVAAYATALRKYMSEVDRNEVGNVGRRKSVGSHRTDVISLPCKGQVAIASMRFAAGEVILKEKPLALQPLFGQANLEASLVCAGCSRMLGDAAAHWRQLPEENRSPFPESGFTEEPSELCPCPGRSCQAVFCSNACRDRALSGHHGLLCNALLNEEQRKAYGKISELYRKAQNCHVLLAIHLAAEVIAKARSTDLPLEEILENHGASFVSGSSLHGGGLGVKGVEDLAKNAEALFRPFYKDLPVAEEIHRCVVSPEALNHRLNMLDLVCVKASFLSPHALALRQAEKDVDQPLASFANTSTGKQLARAYTASAVVPWVARCNHSCIPNILVDFEHEGSDGVFCTVTASRAIASGEELTMEYLPVVGMSFKERQEGLLRQWGFQCECPRCNADSSLSEEDVAFVCFGCESFREVEEDSCPSADEHPETLQC